MSTLQVLIAMPLSQAASGFRKANQGTITRAFQGNGWKEYHFDCGVQQTTEAASEITTSTGLRASREAARLCLCLSDNRGKEASTVTPGKPAFMQTEMVH
ncbi:hypothetical protein TWF106_005238 [Orbilia oligospora]|uniref:Uncharacterized protein n=1 Tax=Orbilia oligospora TaxID=2813651 RepID=A0A6G1M1H9_ORBOL|nr:hypothetical protein TWF788_001000 [Orbilia oligospora]KAF3196162.1 hypothetical protein TWF106_005238 [Orbilia oligospora]KAF3211306.1 hypothetical protein TWF679_006471 [Orbilia oligospora]KAF3212460.1 hypothetical protein TWF191_010460 [Orbilia oligospora]KAF3242209.1 hypothetical protein TWF192_008697 [Orbilia oligospora]